MRHQPTQSGGGKSQKRHSLRFAIRAYNVKGADEFSELDDRHTHRARGAGGAKRTRAAQKPARATGCGTGADCESAV